jgi:peptide deformylase
MKKHRLFLYGLSQPDLFGNHNIGIRTPGIGVENHIKSIAAPRGFLALSATQIGDVWSAFIILKKMFIKNAQWKDYKGLKNSSYDAYLNPKIIDYSVEKKMGWEESASYPGFRFLIERSVKIKVRYSVDKRLDDKEE